MRRLAAGLAVAALCATALVAHAPAAKQGGYATIVEGAYLGGGVFTGTVRTSAKGKIGGKSIRRRCRTARQIDSSTHDGTVPVTVRTTRKGRWTFTLPEEPGRTIKIFVLAKSLPGGGYCTSGILKIQQPEASP